jgi:hypothetical protein
MSAYNPKIIEMIQKQLGVTKEVAREYIMERLYNRLPHDEALENAKNSPWVK